MVISFVCMPPFLAVEHEGNSNGRIVRHRLVQLAMKLVVAHFCRAKDHEIVIEGAMCVWSENAMQFSHHHQLATSLPPQNQSLGWSIAGQYVARLYTGWYSEF